jgi:hypothetical protein
MPADTDYNATQIALNKAAISELTKDVERLAVRLDELTAQANKILAGIAVTCVLLALDILLRLPALINP